MGMGKVALASVLLRRRARSPGEPHSATNQQRSGTDLNVHMGTQDSAHEQQTRMEIEARRASAQEIWTQDIVTVIEQRDGCVKLSLYSWQ
jgi:GTP cyclohydrolase FolE2